MTKIDEIMAQYLLCGDLRIDPFSVISGKLERAEAKLISMIEDAIEVPAGWKFVPVEPTDEMIDIMADHFDAYRVNCVKAYVALLLASPLNKE
jgi:hypothetical protein